MKAAAPYVCARITNMKGVDIHTFDFDFDLTFAALLMHADGTIYHRYGGRDYTSPQSHLSVASLADVLRKTLPEHVAYAKKPTPPQARAALSVDRMPAMQRKRNQPDCYHCHNVHDAMTEELQHRGRFQKRDAWRYPDPREVGFHVEKDDQAVVAGVEPDSPAAKAGLKKGVRLLTLGTARILTMSDVQRVLHEAAGGADRIPVTFRLGSREHASAIQLAAGWKEPSPLHYSWRASKWKLSPKPGFGGPRLNPGELVAAGLKAGTFAFKVQYVVTWGPSAHTGRNALKAGIRKGDVILSIAGRNDFESVEHFHAWFRLTQKAGAKVVVELLRSGKRRSVELTVVD